VRPACLYSGKMGGNGLRETNVRVCGASEALPEGDSRVRVGHFPRLFSVPNREIHAV
jgi:hypothetical protein